MYNSGFLVIEVAPANNEANVPINATVRVKFALDMVVDTLNKSTLLLSKVNGSSIEVDVTYDMRSRTAYIIPMEDLEKGTQYRLTIVGGSKGIMSITGSTLPANKTYEFTTTHDTMVTSPTSFRVEVNDGYPVANWLQPDSYNSDQNLEYKVFISTSSLNPDEDPASVIWPTGADIVGEIKWTTLNIPKKLPNGLYYAYIQAINGSEKSGWNSAQFLVETPVRVDDGSFIQDGFFFEVHATYPEDGAAHINPDSIKILFTDDIDTTTITPSSVYVVKGSKPNSMSLIDLMTKFSPDKAIPFTIDTPSMGNLISLTIDPENFEPGTEYTVIVRETVASKKGSSLGEAHYWSFVSKYVPLFSDAERIRDDIKSFLTNIPDKTLYRYMHDTSLTALEIVSRRISPFNEEEFLEDPPRYMHEYVRYQTGYDLIVNAITQDLKGIGYSRTLGDLTIMPNANIGQITPLIEKFKARIKHWEDQLHGHHNRGYAKPTTAVKSEVGGQYPDFITRTDLNDPSEG